jgi:arginine decarboxylase-like protein
MAENKPGSLLAYAGIIVAILPVLIGLYEYKKNNDREFGKAFLNQQTAVYDELLGDLGSISTSISNPTDSVSLANYKIAKYNFNQLYYGKLNLYQSAVIEKLTDSLYTMINDYDSSKTAYSKRENLEELINRIQDKVYKLSVECKESLKRTYNL